MEEHTMKSINEYIGQELQWVHPKMLSSEYELRGGDELFARLHLKGTFSSQVCAETTHGNWKIVQKGISQAITVLSLDTQTELASLKRGISGQATLLTLDGQEYKWRCSNYWRDVWTWLNKEGTSILHLKRGSRVQFEPTSQSLPDLALLTTLGWYLHKKQEEAATAAAIVPIIG
jgi:hypothetical protein